MSHGRFRHEIKDGIEPTALVGFTDKAVLRQKVEATVEALTAILPPEETGRMHVLQVLAHVVAAALADCEPQFVVRYFTSVAQILDEMDASR
jgi:hypothetical protein